MPARARSARSNRRRREPRIGRYTFSEIVDPSALTVRHVLEDGLPVLPPGIPASRMGPYHDVGDGWPTSTNLIEALFLAESTAKADADIPVVAQRLIALAEDSWLPSDSYTDFGLRRVVDRMKSTVSEGAEFPALLHTLLRWSQGERFSDENDYKSYRYFHFPQVTVLTSIHRRWATLTPNSPWTFRTEALLEILYDAIRLSAHRFMYVPYYDYETEELKDFDIEAPIESIIAAIPSPSTMLRLPLLLDAWSNSHPRVEQGEHCAELTVERVTRILDAIQLFDSGVPVDWIASQW